MIKIKLCKLTKKNIKIKNVAFLLFLSLTFFYLLYLFQVSSDFEYEDTDVWGYNENVKIFCMILTQPRNLDSKVSTNDSNTIQLLVLFL